MSEIQIKEGTLKSKTYTDVEVFGNGFTLKGNTVLTSKKITRFQGKIVDANEMEIGNFNYTEPDGTDMVNDPAGAGTPGSSVYLKSGVDIKFHRLAYTLMYDYVDRINDELKAVEE